MKQTRNSLGIQLKKQVETNILSQIQIKKLKKTVKQQQVQLSKEKQGKKKLEIKASESARKRTSSAVKEVKNKKSKKKATSSKSMNKKLVNVITSNQREENQRMQQLMYQMQSVIGSQQRDKQELSQVITDLNLKIDRLSFRGVPQESSLSVKHLQEEIILQQNMLYDLKSRVIEEKEYFKEQMNMLVVVQGQSQEEAEMEENEQRIFELKKKIQERKETMYTQIYQQNQQDLLFRQQRVLDFDSGHYRVL